MNSNDILRRTRFIFDFNDAKMMALMSSKTHKVTRAEISDFLKKDDDPAQVKLNDSQLAVFLNSLIEEKRGKREGLEPVVEKRLTNNMVFMKLKIALSLKAEDVLDILKLANFKLSKHELSAFFRKPGHKHYRECKDQILRNFLHGLQVKYRSDAVSTKEAKKSKPLKSTTNTSEKSKPKPKSDFEWKPRPKS